MTTFEFTNGFALETVRLIVAFVGGVTPPEGAPGEVTVGVVGDSALHPPKIRISARSANIIFRCLILIISTPVNSTVQPRKRLRAPAAREAEIECHPCVAGDSLAGQRLSKEGQDHVHGDDRFPCFGIDSAVLRQQSSEGRLIERVRIEDDECRSR